MAKTKHIPFKPVNPKTLQDATSKVVGRAGKIENFITRMAKAKANGNSIAPTALGDAKFATTIAKLHGDWNLDGMMKAEIIQVRQIQNEGTRELLVNAEVNTVRESLMKELKNIGSPVDFMENKQRLEDALETYRASVDNIFNETKRRIDLVYPNDEALKKAEIALFGGELQFGNIVTEQKEDELIEAV